MSTPDVTISLNDLAKDIEKYMTTYAREYCKQAADDLTDFAKNTILDFYDDYNPLYYDRTFEFRDHSVKRYYKDRPERGYCVGGVRIGNFGIPKDNYNLDVHDVIDWSLQGYHGVDIMGINKVKPLERLNDFFNDMSWRNKLSKDTHNKCKKLDYKVLDFK